MGVRLLRETAKEFVKTFRISEELEHKAKSVFTTRRQIKRLRAKSENGNELGRNRLNWFNQDKRTRWRRELYPGGLKVTCQTGIKLAGALQKRRLKTAW